MNLHDLPMPDGRLLRWLRAYFPGCQWSIRTVEGREYAGYTSATQERWTVYESVTAAMGAAASTRWRGRDHSEIIY